MEFEDLSDNPRVASLSKLGQLLQQSHTPRETMRAIQQTMTDAYGRVGSMMLATRGLPAGAYRIIQLNLDEAAIKDDDLSPAETVYHGGPISEIIRVTAPRLIHDVRWDSEPIYRDLLEVYDSVAAIPLSTQRLPMTWVLLFKRKPERFTPTDLEEAMLRVALVGSLLESQYMTGELARAKARIDQEVRQAAKLQRMLLPHPLPKIPHLDMAVSYEPSGRAGGDLFDVFRLDEASGGPQRWCVAMAIRQTIVRAYPAHISGPAAMLAHANDHLCRKKLGGFVTAFLLICEPEVGKWCYASAGHPPPLVTGGGRLRKLDGASRIPLGIDPETQYVEASASLHPGDTLLIYTDGITEARNRKSEMFEVGRIEHLLSTTTDTPAGIVGRLRQQVTDFQDGQPAADDQTILVLRIN
jgi:sigma-B regulation protein RsbU (phosphoserine phosphatase)